MTPVLIGVTGGIGSGKSILCRICALRGIPVYDCDSRAKAIMKADTDIRGFLLSEMGEEVYRPDGELDRKLLGARIFNDPQTRGRLEARVHRAVRHDLDAWLSSLDGRHGMALVESAILHTSALDATVDGIWLVQAPMATRMHRVMARSALSRPEVEARMKAQQAEFDSLPQGKVDVIVNDGLTPLLPAIDALLIKTDKNHHINNKICLRTYFPSPASPDCSR